MSAQDFVRETQSSIEFDATGKPLKADGIAGPLTRAAATALFDAQASGSPWPVATPPGPVPVPTQAIYGADTVDLISATSIAQMRQLLGAVPAFVSRYFNGPYEYKHAQEDGPAHAANIRILPIGDQTKHVNGTMLSGTNDGNANAADIINTFGADYLASQGVEYFVPLDCEGDPDLSVAYWTGWSAAILATSKSMSGGRVKLLPMVYASSGDGGTWAALKAAMANGALCFGAWVASYETTAATNLPLNPAWNPNRAKMTMPDGSSPPNVPIFLWQFAGFPSGTFEPHDCNMINPAIDSKAFLARCILPPSSAIA